MSHQAHYEQAPLMHQQQQPGGPAGGGGYGPSPQQDVYSQGAYATTSLKSMPATTAMNLAFFGAAVCLIVASFVASIALFCSGQMVDSLEMVYFLAFGGVLGVLDTPFMQTMKFVEDMKDCTAKYVNFLTRVTGKGFIYVFLGASLFTSMWTNLDASFPLCLAVVLCSFASIVGFVAIFLGFTKSQKLNRARTHLAQGVLDNRYPFHATTYRGEGGGLTLEEFNNLTIENGGFKWEDADLKLIFNALVIHPSWRNPAAGGQLVQKIPKQDLQTWVSSGSVML